MAPLAHTLAVLGYLVAALLGWLAPSGSRRANAVVALLIASAALQAIGFVGFHYLTPPVPLESMAAALSLIGWLIASGYLISLSWARVTSVGPWIGATAFLFTALAELGLRLAPPSSVPSAPTGAWPHAHVLLSTAGFGLLTLASLGGLAYIAKERALKRKRGFGVELPSLESLDKVGQLGLALGFPLLTLGVATGFVWAARASETIWTGHALFLTLAWAAYAIPIGQRLLAHAHGQAPARGAVIGFLILWFAYLGVRLIGAVA